MSMETVLTLDERQALKDTFVSPATSCHAPRTEMPTPDDVASFQAAVIDYPDLADELIKDDEFLEAIMAAVDRKMGLTTTPDFAPAR